MRPYSTNWCLCEWEERVVASPWFNTSFIGVNVRSACIYLFFTTAYVNGPFLHLDSCWQKDKTIMAIYKTTYGLLLLVLQCLHFQLCQRETHSSVIAKRTARSTVSIFTLSVGLGRANGCVYVHVYVLRPN